MDHEAIPLSVQLWSTRGEDPLAAQLRYLADLGFTDAQPYHDQYADIGALKDQLSAAGLSCRSGLFRFSMFEGDASAVIRPAQALGMELVGAPWLDPDMRPADKQGWRALNAVLAGFKERVEGAGLRFAWHNHEFEFAPFPDGSMPIEYLLGENIDFLADLGWIARAGESPVDWLRRYRGRIAGVHVKDVAPPGEALDEAGFADIGAGVVDWAPIWRTLSEIEVPLRTAEHDQPNDWRRFAANAARALKRLNAGEMPGAAPPSAGRS